MKKIFITYSVIFSYLALFTANIFHFHHISLNNFKSEVVSEEGLNASLKVNHPSIQCPVHNSFNSIHTFNFTGHPNFSDIFISPKKINLIRSDFFYNFHFYTSSNLRAPPSLFF